MSTTLLIVCIAFALYVGTCIYQFRKLGRHEGKHPDKP
jgi:hypothetical protein